MVIFIDDLDRSSKEGPGDGGGVPCRGRWRGPVRRAASAVRGAENCASRTAGRLRALVWAGSAAPTRADAARERVALEPRRRTGIAPRFGRSTGIGRIGSGRAGYGARVRPPGRRREGWIGPCPSCSVSRSASGWTRKRSRTRRRPRTTGSCSSTGMTTAAGRSHLAKPRRAGRSNGVTWRAGADAEWNHRARRARGTPVRTSCATGTGQGGPAV